MIKNILIFILFTAISGCSALIQQNPSPAAGQKINNEAVTFNTDINSGIFHDTATITVRIYNSGQTELADKTSDCPVSMDGQLLCPDGISYPEIRPQTYVFRKSDFVNGQIIFRTNHIKQGENYRIHISGLAADNCNTVLTTINGTADTTTVNISDPQWGSTRMACLP